MKIVALAGGVGGAKLADGFYRLQDPVDLTVIVNTGDDFQLFGLYICPDLDTVCYNLAGMENPATGWGREGESWGTIEGVHILGGPNWFRLGNKDLATHLERTRRIESGDRLSNITADFCQAWNIKAAVLPMSDDPVPTLVQTDQGLLPFQEYFAKRNCEPEVRGFNFQDVEHSRPAPGVLEVINQADLVVICPSNPWVSIDPILAVPGIRAALEARTVMAISPLIGGEAVKGPAAKMYREMGIQPTAAAVARHYQGLLSGFVIDNQDSSLADEIQEQAGPGMRILCTDTWMTNRQERIKLAESVMEFGTQLLKEV